VVKHQWDGKGGWTAAPGEASATFKWPQKFRRKCTIEGFVWEVLLVRRRARGNPERGSSRSGWTRASGPQWRANCRDAKEKYLRWSSGVEAAD
jgi:hypothetical protein